MRTELVELLRCPRSSERLRLQEAEYESDRVRAGWLVSESNRYRYPVREFIPRFVPESNYSDSFGFQWNRFRKTQLDSFSGYPISATRFWNATTWNPEELEGGWVLDVGCGAGRFAEIALQAGANVVAIDYSSSVDSCFANLQGYAKFHVLQADIYALPLANHQFDFVYSLGVLQHTPDVRSAFAALPPMLKRGGRLCVDYYQRHWKSRLLPKYSLRPITKRMPKPRLFSIVESLVPRLLPISRMLARLPMGHVICRAVPVADPIYFFERAYGKIEMSMEDQASWALLDTFDWLSPEYDNPQTYEDAQLWMAEAGLGDIEVLKAGHLVARGRVPLS